MLNTKNIPRGVSGQEYVVPYKHYIGAALDTLRREDLAAGDYVKPSSFGDVFDLPGAASVDDLTEQEQYSEFMGTSGTHSIIDVLSGVPAVVGVGVRRPAWGWRSQAGRPEPAAAASRPRSRLSRRRPFGAGRLVIEPRRAQAWSAVHI
jgi:hypothetical protein